MIFLLPFSAIVLGYFIGRFLVKKQHWVAYLLSFSGSFLLSITLFEMLPDVFQNGSKVMGVYIMGGLLLQIILEFFSKGAEHGHIHLPKNQHRFPVLLFLSLSVHAFIEGFPITSNTHVLWGVVLHKIPIAMILSIYFIKANVSTIYTGLFLLLFALMTPLGSYVSEYASLSPEYFQKINAVAIGIFLHVSTTILFESSKNHRFNFTKLFTILLGAVVAYII